MAGVREPELGLQQPVLANVLVLVLAAELVSADAQR